MVITVCQCQATYHSEGFAIALLTIQQLYSFKRITQLLNVCDICVANDIIMCDDVIDYE